MARRADQEMGMWCRLLNRGAGHGPVVCASKLRSGNQEDWRHGWSGAVGEDVKVEPKEAQQVAGVPVWHQRLQQEMVPGSEQ